MELEEIKAGLIVKNKKTGILYMVIQSNISAVKEILLSDNELAQFYDNYTHATRYLMRAFPVVGIVLNTTRLVILNLLSGDYEKDVQFTEDELKTYVTKLHLIGLNVDLSYCYDKVKECVSLKDISKGAVLLNENVTAAFFFETGYFWDLMLPELRVRLINLVIEKISEKEYCLYSVLKNNDNYYVVNSIKIDLSKRGNALVEDIKSVIRYGMLVGKKINFKPIPYKSKIEFEDDYKSRVNHYLKRYSYCLEKEDFNPAMKGCKLKDVRETLKNEVRNSPSFNCIRAVKYKIESEKETFIETGYIPLSLENKILDSFMNLLKDRLKKERNVTLTENEQKEIIKEHIHNYENYLLWM